MGPKKALRERDSNISMANDSTESKRKRVQVDLTGDSSTEDEEPAPKVKKSAAAVNGARRVANGAPPRASQYQTAPASGTQPPPSSSAPTGSQRAYQPPPSSPADHQHSQTERHAWFAVEDDSVDVDEIVSSTQQAADNDQLQLYGDMPTKIVGVQYYRGLANPGEYILMRREPGNPYDSNAIRIDNVSGQQIGHIPRRIAEKLSTYMDHGWLCVEGRLAGSIGPYDCPLKVNVFGPDVHSEAGKQLQAKMVADKLPIKALKEAERREKERQKELERQQKAREKEEKGRLAEARRAAAGAGKGGRILSSSQSDWANQTMPGSSSQPVMQDLVEASQRFNPREAGQATDKYGMQEEVLKNMPTTTKPDAIKTDMLPYQLQALRWLLDQENPQLPPEGTKDTVQLWKRQGNAFVNIATNHPTKDAPALASGGILADDMGLGKTLEMISLIVADAEKHGRGTTLVVAPLSVMSNWSGQIARHIHKDKALSVYTYHGKGRVNMKPADFEQYDVVITTYQTLASDYMPQGKGASNKQPERKLRSSGLYSMDWRRAILDEGHTVRNPASKGAAAVTALTARSRWILTGTPIVNSLKDLYSLLRFIGISGGIEQLPVFNSVLVRPLKDGDESARYLLQAIMGAFTLRRRKEMAFIDLRLPKLEEYIHNVQFTPKETERYTALATEAQGLLKKAEGGQNKVQAYNHLLEILLRMRQCCNHWQLCGERVTNLLAQLEHQKVVDLTPENKKALQDYLQVQIESQEDCAICLETLHNPVVTACMHAFGQECITKVIETQHKCPMCRAELKDETMLVPPAREGGDEAADAEMDLTQSSSKLEGLMKILGVTKAKGDKTVVFSQWTRFLDIVQARLDREGYKYCRIDGTMTAPQRDAALQALETDPTCTIMLASLGVCAVGLNLTAANQVILSDSWWAPAIEDQAVDRVHRLGQKKETRVWRLVVEGTIENRTLGIQAEKRSLMQLAFSEKAGKRSKAKASRLADIQRLLAPEPQTAGVGVDDARDGGVL